MESIIVRYLSKYIELTEELENALAENLLIREYPKGTILLQEGEICTECFFILKGLIRTYYLKEYEEVTTDFHMEEQVVSPSCYGQNTLSDLFLECLEDTVAFVGTPQMESDMYLKYPQLETLSRVIGEKIMSSYRDSLDAFKMSSPEERYLNLVKNNYDLIQRAPQYQIASFLGIKPESLSRIRKRISKSK
ncbi:MAG: Crp/Fnr family transcriptional regulator [Spirochaetales bacterium]|nr:Crp/Fnr family transcriptional regulator [Spirochaetales bacterium]